jgi:hypothetical protein
MTTAKMKREIDVIYPIQVNGETKEKYALSLQGELFIVQGETKTAATVHVTPTSKTSFSTRVSLDSKNYSLATIIAENLQVSAQEAQAMVKAKYGSGFYPQTYKIMKGASNEDNNSK